VVYAIAPSGGTVYVGGGFNYILGLPHCRFAGVSQGMLGVKEPAAVLPGRLRVSPNPFHTGVTLRFVLPRAEKVDVAVYDVAGRLVRRLHRGVLAAGEQRLDWDGRNDAGRAAGAGLYLVRVQSASLGASTRALRLR